MGWEDRLLSGITHGLGGVIIIVFVLALIFVIPVIGDYVGGREAGLLAILLFFGIFFIGGFLGNS